MYCVVYMLSRGDMNEGLCSYGVVKLLSCGVMEL